MPVMWNLKKWLAVEHDIYRPSELQVLLAEKAGVRLSLPAVSALFNNKPNALRLHTVQALCNALHCKLSDFCEVLPDTLGGQVQQVEQQSVEYDEVEQKPEVDAATRAIILRILEEQGLIPSGSSSSLDASPDQRRLIGMLIPVWAWPLVPDLTRGIVEAVKQTPYDLVLYSINDEDLERDRREVINRLLATQLTAGLLAVFPDRVSQQLTHLYHQGFPVVIIDDQEVQSTPWVGADNTTGALLAVRHLISLGHRRIAHIKGPSEYLVSHDRYQGYCQALSEAGLTPNSQLVLQGDFMPQSGRACASTLFDLPLEQRPTAIFAASDQMAYGVLAAAEAYGLSIPQDIALVGFDDDAPSAHIHPALTTVRQPYFEMGQQGITLLLSMLNASPVPNTFKQGSNDARSTRIQLPTRLVVRASCGANYHTSVSAASGNVIL